MGIRNRYLILSLYGSDDLGKILQGNYDIVMPMNGRMQSLKASLGRIFGKYKLKSQEDQIAESFGAFIIAHNYNTDQTRFLRVIKSVFLAKIRRHELLEIDDFYEGPVEAFGAGAVDRLFSKDDLGEVIEFLKEHKVYGAKG